MQKKNYFIKQNADLRDRERRTRLVALGALDVDELRFRRDGGADGGKIKAAVVDFMGIMRWTLLDRVRKTHPKLPVENTYGYLTKHKRIALGLPKTHCADAFCIAGNLKALRRGDFLFQQQTRKHNRQIHRCSILKGGVRKLNQAPFLVKGFRLFDKVRIGGQIGFVFGRRVRGIFNIRRLDKTVIGTDINCKKLSVLDPAWADQVKVRGKILFIIEGLTMYMKADEVRTMLAIIRDHFDNAYVCMETLCPYFVKKENIEKSIQATGATFTWGANSFADLGNIAAGFRKVKDDNIARGMETLNPIYKPVMWMPIVHKFAEKILVFEKA